VRTIGRNDDAVAALPARDALVETLATLRVRPVVVL
jgi:hypothetical protein